MLDKFKTEQLPLNFLLKYAFQIFKKHFGIIFFTSMFVFIPMFAIRYMDIAKLISVHIDLPMPPEDKLLFLDNIVLLFIYACFLPLIYSALTAIAKKEIEGKPVNIFIVMDASIVLWGKHFITSIIYLTLVILGSILVFPGIFALIAFYFFPHITAITGLSGLRALTLSYNIVNGQWIKTTILICFGVIGSIVIANICYSLMPDVENVDVLIIILFEVIVNTINNVFNILVALWFLNNFYIKSLNTNKA